MLEESYQVYYKALGYDEPFQTTSHTGPRVKLNFLTWYSGYWEGTWAGYAHMNVDTTGLRDEGPGSPVPHEFGHAIQSNQLGNLAGGHWESDANYLRKNRNTWFAPIFGSATVSTVTINPLVWSNFQQDAHRIIYEDYRIHLALQDYAESLGLPADEAARLWRLGNTGQTAWAKLASLLPAGTSIKDVAAHCCATGRCWTFRRKTTFAPISGRRPTQRPTTCIALARHSCPRPISRVGIACPSSMHRKVRLHVPRTDVPRLGPRRSQSLCEDWICSHPMRIGDGRWPQSMALAMCATAIFRAPGTQTFALNPGENKVLLIVVATPGNAAEDLDSFYNTKAVDKNADRLRYPYEVQINGATPTVEPLNWNPTGSFHYYTNPDGSPGGLVENTATVASTAYIGPNAKVLGTSQVLNNAKVLDYAVIANNARIRNNAVVSGYAVVRNNGVVQDNALVTDHAIVENNAQVQASAVVEQYARLGDSAIIRGQAIARGDSYLWGSGSTAANLSGYAIADYDYSMNYSDISDGNQFNHIPFDNYFDAYYAQTQKKPRRIDRLISSEETSGEVLWDEFGSQEAWLRVRRDGSAIRFSTAARC